MFPNIYSFLSNAYNYLDTSIRNNPFLFSLVPVLYQMITPALYSNIPQLETINPYFKSVYDNVTNKNLNNKNTILNWIQPENMGNSNTKNNVNVNTKNNVNKPIEVKKKKQAIPKKIRDAVWVKYCGNGDEGVCYCCNEKVKRYKAGWQCSHVFSENMGGEISVENLRVNCSSCNLSMGNQNLYAYIRDKKLKGPGSKNVDSYFKKNPSEINSKRTNNWGNNKKKSQENKNKVANNVSKNDDNKKNKNWLSEWI